MSILVGSWQSIYWGQSKGALIERRSSVGQLNLFAIEIGYSATNICEDVVQCTNCMKCNATSPKEKKE